MRSWLFTLTLMEEGYELFAEVNKQYLNSYKNRQVMCNVCVCVNTTTAANVSEEEIQETAVRQ